MSSRTNITLFGLLCSGLIQGCVDDAVVGTSGQITIDLPQTTLGAFAYDSSTAIADVNNDGTGDLIVWTNASQPFDFEFENGEVTLPPVGVFVFFGGEGHFEGQLGPADADLTLTIPEAKFVGRVAAQDLDGDGIVDLIVHLVAEPSRHFWPMPVRSSVGPHGVDTGVYVVKGGSLPTGVHPLTAVAQHTPAYGFTSEYMVHSPHEFQDLDGVPGQEFLTEPYCLVDVGNTVIHVRDLETGETRARLLAPEDTYLDVRGVLDHDGDGASDVAVLWTQTDGRNPNSVWSWNSLSIAIFYGPFEGDITVGDEGTMSVYLLGAAFFHTDMESLGPDGAARTVIGDFCGDATEDLLLTTAGSDVAPSTRRGVYCVPGGSRDAQEALIAQRHGELRLDLQYPRWTVAARPAGADRTQLFVMGIDAFAFITPELGVIAGDLTMEEEVVNRAGLSYAMPQDSPLFTSLGGAMGDLDGDGVLDVALGTKARELESESLVHVIYGFGG
ncbi:MAG: hypothetical protein IPL19_02720 [Sandaracinaceae bacterium]|nr:hypothetical protein [Sandaracinaceae bacterium]MBK8406879.1 hypothetical protein [Sandaracinaceae bacterium]